MTTEGLQGDGGSGGQVEQQPAVGEDVPLDRQRRVRDGRDDQAHLLERCGQGAGVAQVDVVVRRRRAGPTARGPHSPPVSLERVRDERAEGTAGPDHEDSVTLGGHRIPKTFTNIGVSMSVCGAIAW